MPRIDAGEAFTPLLDRPEFQTPDGREALLGESFHVIRPEGMDDAATGYYDFISNAIRTAHRGMSPDVLRDPSKLQVVTCVDPNAVIQTEGLSPELAAEYADPENQKPGGLYYLWKTGLMKPWISARMFGPRLVGALHRGCGAILLSAGNDQRIAQAVRGAVMTDLHEEVNHQASVIRGVWLQKPGLSEPAVDAIHDFHGPAVVSAPVSSSGTASGFMKPRHADTFDPRDMYSMTTLHEEREKWLDQRLSGTQAHVHEAEVALGGVDAARPLRVVK